MKALLSVFDKTGLVGFGQRLSAASYDLVSTGGTSRELRDAGIPVTQVSELTGFPEILEGRVKTLHPFIHGGILARRDLSDQMAQLTRHKIGTIDIVVANLYPFLETVSRPGVTTEDALENIDVGGPTMIRAAAKNFESVLVLVDPDDYEWVGERLISGNVITLGERRDLAAKAFQHVAYYDSAIFSWLSQGGSILDAPYFTPGLEKVDDLRYGENPHQRGAVYADTLGTGGIIRAEQCHGLPMSYTNYLDAESAWTTVSDFEKSSCVVVKHTNPCGIALNDHQPTAYENAFQGDPVSAYGGIVGFNRVVTMDTAEAMRGVLFDIIVAPGYEEEALAILKKRKRTRVLKVNVAEGPTEGISFKSVSGGALVQTANNIEEDPSRWRTVTNRAPTKSEIADLSLAWKVGKHIKSNTIVLVKDDALVGMGAGQPNRVVSIHLALRIAGEKAKGSVLASDAFMPFADNIEIAVSGGVTAVVQPGGSIRDDDVIKAADDHEIAMLFTGVRHFNH